MCGADTVRPLLLSLRSALPARPAENILEIKNILVRTSGVLSPADHSATGELRQQEGLKIIERSGGVRWSGQLQVRDRIVADMRSALL